MKAQVFQSCLEIGYDCSTKKITEQQHPRKKVWQQKPHAHESKITEGVIKANAQEADNHTEEVWTQAGSNRVDRTKKKITFTPQVTWLCRIFSHPYGLELILWGSLAILNDFYMEC